MDKTVLIVEDSDEVRFYLSLYLTKEGFKVIEAEHGKDALNKLNGHKVDIVITDLNMPVMNGIEFISQLRRIPLHCTVPVIVMTAESDEVKKYEAEHAGINDWIDKPFTPLRLKESIVKLTNEQ